jgi:iron complex outermembrane receptor protein
LGYADFKAATEQTVTFYVDDVVLGRPTGALMDLLDLERVEVLRGPQGTLFGKNAIGGVVRMVSRKPGEGDGGGNVEVTVGSYDRVDLRAAFETTLVEDKLFSRVSFASKQRNGFMNLVDFRCAMIAAGTPELAGVGDGIVGWDTVTNTAIMGVPFSDEDNEFALPQRITQNGTRSNCAYDRLGDTSVQAARGVLRFTPNDKFEFNLMADVTDQDDTASYQLTSGLTDGPARTQQFNRQTALPRFGIPHDARFNAPDIFTSYSGFGNGGTTDSGLQVPNVSAIRQWGTSATLDFFFAAIDVKMILAHREYDAQWGQDTDGSPMAIAHLYNVFSNDQNSVELRVSGSLFKGKTSWTVGYFDFDSEDLGSNIQTAVPCIGITSCVDQQDDAWVDSSALFLNTQTELTERLSLTVGLRNTDDSKDILQQRYDRLLNPCCGFQDPRIVTSATSRTDPMVSLAYQLNDDSMVYGTVQRGFRGGGTSTRPTGTTRIPFGPETLTNREIGIKTDLLDNRLRLNASIFDMTYEDIQRGAAGFDELGELAFVTTNAGEASITGFEIETQASIGDRWALNGTISNLDYELTDLGAASPEALAAAGLNTNNSPDPNDGPERSPEYTASLNLSYFLNMSNGAEMSIRLGSSWRDDAWWGPDGNDAIDGNKVPAHTLSNFRVTWMSPSQEWQAAIFCTNCADERTTVGRLDFRALSNTLSEFYARPVEWGFSIRKDF